ncbi:MAG: class I SAM-dependent methyltransferase [Rickettsiales bacterium]
MAHASLLDSTPDEHFRAFLYSTDEKCLTGRTTSAFFRALLRHKIWQKGQKLSVVDVGCGHGDFAVALAEGAFDAGLEIGYEGVDLSGHYAGQAAERMAALGFSARARKADLFSAESVVAPCDVISASHALYYTKFQPNEKTALSAALTLWEEKLRPGGMMLFVHQSAKSPWLKFSAALGDSKFDKIEKQIERSCKKLGLPTTFFSFRTRIAFPDLGDRAKDLGDPERYDAHKGEEDFRMALMLAGFAAEGRGLAALATSGQLAPHVARMAKSAKKNGGYLQTEQIVRVVLRKADKAMLPSFMDAVRDTRDVETEIAAEAGEALAELAEADPSYAWLAALAGSAKK